MMDNNILFRTIRETEGDQEFLYKVYSSTDAARCLVEGWPDDEARRMLQIQFQLQDANYRQMYPDASYTIIVVNEKEAGRIYLDRGHQAHHLIEITLLPEFRSQGIGRRIMNDLLAEAEQLGKKLTLQVDADNPVGNFYRNLGFIERGANRFYRGMAWMPGSSRS